MNAGYFRLIALCWVSWLGLLLAGPATAQTFFEEVTEEIGVPLIGSRSTAFGDYDNDGRPDMFCAESFYGEGTRISLLHNEGNARFGDRTAAIQAEVSPEPKGGGAIFGDYDNDGGPGSVCADGVWLR